jgi:hypothetical protein
LYMNTSLDLTYHLRKCLLTFFAANAREFDFQQGEYHPAGWAKGPQRWVG